MIIVAPSFSNPSFLKHFRPDGNSGLKSVSEKLQFGDGNLIES